MPNRKHPTIEYKNNDTIPELVEKNKENIESMFKHGIADPTQVIKNTKDIKTNKDSIESQDQTIDQMKSILGSVSATFPDELQISHVNPITNLPWKLGNIVQITNYQNSGKESIGLFTDNSNWIFLEPISVNFSENSELLTKNNSISTKEAHIGKRYSGKQSYGYSATGDISIGESSRKKLAIGNNAFGEITLGSGLRSYLGIGANATGKQSYGYSATGTQSYGDRASGSTSIHFSENNVSNKIEFKENPVDNQMWINIDGTPKISFRELVRKVLAI